ncbi:MAG: hypothetical protein GJ676_08035 [Rhodobacteraceae bacterium]|nr:hypothetical protein [Paracoccaceae bacterium]
MFKRIKEFFRREDGAVTVDWVVLTAAVVGLAGVAYNSIQDASGGIGSNTGDYLANKEVE